MPRNPSQASLEAKIQELQNRIAELHTSVDALNAKTPKLQSALRTAKAETLTITKRSQRSSWVGAKKPGSLDHYIRRKKAQILAGPTAALTSNHDAISRIQERISMLDRQLTTQRAALKSAVTEAEREAATAKTANPTEDSSSPATVSSDLEAARQAAASARRTDLSSNTAGHFQGARHRNRRQRRGRPAAVTAPTPRQAAQHRAQLTNCEVATRVVGLLAATAALGVGVYNGVIPSYLAKGVQAFLTLEVLDGIMRGAGPEQVAEQPAARGARP